MNLHWPHVVTLPMQSTKSLSQILSLTSELFLPISGEHHRSAVTKFPECPALCTKSETTVLLQTLLSISFNYISNDDFSRIKSCIWVSRYVLCRASRSPTDHAQQKIKPELLQFQVSSYRNLLVRSWPDTHIMHARPESTAMNPRLRNAQFL